MTVTEELLEKGYCILRGCVPRQQLDSLRAHCEEMLERHKRWWADHREPGEPPGGEWETGIQPRVLFDRVVDRDAHEIVDFVFHENTHGICRQEMGTEDVAPTQFGMLCNPRRDRGPADWHRDIRPGSHCPVEAFYTDFLANPPNYTQWNIRSSTTTSSGSFREATAASTPKRRTGSSPSASIGKSTWACRSSWLPETASST